MGGGRFGILRGWRNPVAGAISLLRGTNLIPGATFGQGGGDSALLTVATNSTYAFLDGKVLKTSLATIHGRPSPDAPRLRRLLLDQGELSHFWDGDQPINYIAFVELREGTTRGNHYHKVKRELFYVISGEVLLTAQAANGQEKVNISIGTGEFAQIDAAVAHVFKVLKPGQAVEFSEARFDASDVYPFRLA